VWEREGTSKCMREKEKDLGDCKHMDKEREKSELKEWERGMGAFPIPKI